MNPNPATRPRAPKDTMDPVDFIEQYDCVIHPVGGSVAQYRSILIGSKRGTIRKANYVHWYKRASHKRCRAYYRNLARGHYRGMFPPMSARNDLW